MGRRNARTGPGHRCLERCRCVRPLVAEIAAGERAVDQPRALGMPPVKIEPAARTSDTGLATAVQLWPWIQSLALRRMPTSCSRATKRFAATAVFSTGLAAMVRPATSAATT